MKIPTREILLVVTPMLLVGVGFAAKEIVSSRQERAKPTIDGCTLRQPNGEEAFRGGKVVLECKQSWPLNSSFQDQTVISNGQRIFGSHDGSWMDATSDASGSESWTENGRTISTKSSILNLKNLSPDGNPFDVESSLFSQQTSPHPKDWGEPLVKQSFNLNPKTVPPFELKPLVSTKGEITRVQMTPRDDNGICNLLISYRYEGEPSHSITNMSVIEPRFVGGYNVFAFGDIYSMEVKGEHEAEYQIPIHVPSESRTKSVTVEMEAAIESEWPLHLAITLPDAEPTEVVDLTYKAKLASIPASLVRDNPELAPSKN